MNKLAILCDDLKFSRKLMNYIIKKNQKTCLSSFAVNSKETIKDVNNLHANDILILDLGLVKINVLHVMNKLRKMGEEMPSVIVVYEDEETLHKLNNYKDYIYTTIKKPMNFQKMTELIEKITYETECTYYEDIVKEELHQFDVNVTTKGYKYLVDAIVLTLQNEELLTDMQNGLYKSMSIKNNNRRISNIKWTLEKFIKSTARYTSKKIAKQYFRIEMNEKLTPKLFIATVVEKIKIKLGNENKQNSEKEEIYS